MDWLNFGMEGVGGVKFVEFGPPIFSPGPVVGVKGKELAADVGGDSRLTALSNGKKIPAPGVEVVK
jgi:hypothetical protein